jgi:hypothetical protein
MQKMHKKQIGTFGEMTIARDLLSQGFQVFTEFGDLSKVDLIVLSDNSPVKIQVKAYAEKNGTVTLFTTKSGPNYQFRYTEKMADVFAVYVYNRDMILYVSAKELLSNKRTVMIRIDETHSGQTKKIRPAKNYTSFINAVNYVKPGA